MRKPKKVDPLRSQVDGICLRVAHAREKLGMTQRQLSAKIGAGQNFIHQVETGRGPTGALLKFLRLAEALQVDPGELLTGLDEGER